MHDLLQGSSMVILSHNGWSTLM